MKKINFGLQAGGHITISEGDDLYSQLLFIQGSLSELYGIYALQGYGDGTDIRNHFTPIQSGNKLAVEISGKKYIVKNTGTVAANCTLVLLLGTVPIIS